jgi:hypothetical protein
MNLSIDYLREEGKEEDILAKNLKHFTQKSDQDRLSKRIKKVS